MLKMVLECVSTEKAKESEIKIHQNTKNEQKEKDIKNIAFW